MKFYQYLAPLVLNWLKARAMEKTTYAGLFVFLATNFGLQFDANAQNAIVEILMSVAGLLMVVLSDSKWLSKQEPKPEDKSVENK